MVCTASGHRTADRVDTIADADITVGGTVLDLVLGQLADHARIVSCGAISAYK
jgi:NADPH-dependent curcumin reductase CurA